MEGMKRLFNRITFLPIWVLDGCCDVCDASRSVVVHAASSSLEFRLGMLGGNRAKSDTYSEDFVVRRGFRWRTHVAFA